MSVRSARGRYQPRTAPRLLTAERQVASGTSPCDNSMYGFRRKRADESVPSKAFSEPKFVEDDCGVSPLDPDTMPDLKPIRVRVAPSAIRHGENAVREDRQGRPFWFDKTEVLSKVPEFLHW